MKEKIIFILAPITKLSEQDVSQMIEIPVDSKLGDYAFPCFSLAKEWKKNPAIIAQEIVLQIKKNKDFEKIEAVGPYVNFFVNSLDLARNTINKIIASKKTYGSIKDKQRIMVEFASPNTNKPLHLGHVRNLSIGDSISRILTFCGNTVIRTSINNDRGVHICKSMLAYKDYGIGKTPLSEKKKSDHFVGDYYVLFNKRLAEQPDYEQKAQEILQKWERGDKSVIELWKKMNGWAFKGFSETYRKFGISFDKEYYESQIYTFGKDIVLEGLKNKVFEKLPDGAVSANLSSDGLGEKILLRADGTSIYITQDIYLAQLKEREYKLDGSIYVVGNEQDHHFRVLFAILKKLGFHSANKLNHLSYGMVELPDGRMKSREGTVVDADDLLFQTQELALKEIINRHKIKKTIAAKRANAIALAAIKYSMLKTDVHKTIIFNPKEAIHFEGDTGPYLLYSYARAQSILRKSKKNVKEKKILTINEKEKLLVTYLAQFPGIVSKSYTQLSPHIIANYAFTLAQTFNEFYHACSVVGSDEEAFRLKLVSAFSIVMENALNLLGIPILKEM